MQYTENYHFPIYEASDKPSAANWNNCFETIDETMGKGGHEILDNAGNTIEQKDKLQFKTPLTVGNQSDATVVNVDTNVDLSGIIPPVVVLPTRPEAYSTDEIEIGTWIDGRVIYRKVYDNLNVTLNDNQWNTILDVSSLSIDIALHILILGTDLDTYGNLLDLISVQSYVKNDNIMGWKNKQGQYCNVNKIAIDYVKVVS